MIVNGFSEKDFETFMIPSLPERMAAIETRIRPQFRSIGKEITDQLSMELNQEMFLHIAKHARRTVNPPQDTWLAIANNKRGYKKHPHFQVGLFDDHLFIWLAFIYELPNKAQIASTFMQHPEIFHDLPKDFVVSLDHTKKDATPLATMDQEAALRRFRDIKKAEFLIGRHIPKGSSIVEDGPALLAYISATMDELVPLYQLAYQ